MDNKIQVKNTLPPVTLDPSVIESLVINGDLSRLNQAQKVMFYNYRCQQADLDPAAKPFDLLKLNGKEVLYANASATQQLCANRKLSTQITHREKLDDIYVVSARCTGSDGRISENQGAVSIAGLRGDALANAILKATTKAIRRVVLAHCGLGILDETETETIPTAQKVSLNIEQPASTAPSIANLPEDDFTLEEPSIDDSPYKIWVPNLEEPYELCPDMEAYKQAMFELCDKIINNTKLTNEEKDAKLISLRARNDEQITGLPATERIQFIAKFAAIRTANETKKQ